MSVLVSRQEASPNNHTVSQQEFTDHTAQSQSPRCNNTIQTQDQKAMQGLNPWSKDMFQRLKEVLWSGNKVSQISLKQVRQLVEPLARLYTLIPH